MEASKRPFFIADAAASQSKYGPRFDELDFCHGGGANTAGLRRIPCAGYFRD
jgi:hypothetical protein